IATPRASPTLSAEATFLPKKRSSSAIALGSCQRSSSPSESCRRVSLRSAGRSEGVSITPPSSATIRSPDVRTTPNPVLAVPGSIPMTITLFHSRSAPGCPLTIGDSPEGSSRIAQLMRGSGRRTHTLATLIVAVAAALIVASPAIARAKSVVITRTSGERASKSTEIAGSASAGIAKKKKKKKPPAVTNSASVAFTSGSTQAATANCTRKTHISGGGYSVGPNFVPTRGISGSGLRSATGINNPVAPSSWTASSSAWATPPASGQLTTYARCESNTLGTLAVSLSGAATVLPGSLNVATINCPPGTHVLTGGYAGPGLGTFTF